METHLYIDGGNGVPPAGTDDGAPAADDEDDDDDDEEVDLGFSLLGGNLLDDLFAPTTKKPTVAASPVKATLVNPPAIKYVPNRTGVVNQVGAALATNKMPTKTKKKAASNRIPPKAYSKESDSSQQSSSGGQSGLTAEWTEDLQEQREDLAEEQADALDELPQQYKVDTKRVRSTTTATRKVSRTKKASSSNDDIFGLGYLHGFLNWLT